MRVSAAGLAWCAVLALALPARAQNGGTLSAIEADVERLARRARPCVVTVVAQRVPNARPGQARRTLSRVGSGVAVAAHEVLTTASVVAGAEKVFVVTGNHLQVEARVVGLDPVRNLALLAPEGLELSPLQLAAEPARSGDWVIALGNSYRGAPTQSVGHVALRFDEPGTSLIQLTNEVHPGNSGGAAVNSRGELLGLVQGELGAPQAPGRRDRDERRPGGMAFAIPTDDILPFLDGLARHGRVRHGMFGVSTRGAFVEGAGGPGDRVPLGAIVEAVVPGGAAARLGLRRGDLVVGFGDERVEYPEQLARWIAVAGPGTEVRVVWVRDEMRQEGRVRLDEAPSALPSWMKLEPTPAAAPRAAADTRRAGARAAERASLTADSALR